MSKLRECVSKMGFAWGFRTIGFQIETENGKSKTTVSCKTSELHLHDVVTSEVASLFLSYVNYPIICYSNQFFFFKQEVFNTIDIYICVEIILFEIIIFFIPLIFILLNFIIWCIILTSERDRY